MNGNSMDWRRMGDNLRWKSQTNARILPEMLSSPDALHCDPGQHTPRLAAGMHQVCGRYFAIRIRRSN
jgi:hypothetical protein